MSSLTASDTSHFHPIFSLSLARAKEALECIEYGWRKPVDIEDATRSAVSLLNVKITHLAHAILLRRDDDHDAGERELALFDSGVATFRFYTSLSRYTSYQEGLERRLFVPRLARFLDALILTILRTRDVAIGSEAPADGKSSACKGIEGALARIANVCTHIAKKRKQVWVRAADAPDTPLEDNYYYAWAKVQVCDMALELIDEGWSYVPARVEGCYRAARNALDALYQRPNARRKSFVEDEGMLRYMQPLQTLVMKWQAERYGDIE